MPVPVGTLLKEGASEAEIELEGAAEESMGRQIYIGPREP